MTLKEGDKLDSVLTRNVMNHKISHWARATVVTVMDPPDQFYIAFENEPSSSNRLINRMGYDIAPPNTFTDDFDWRYEIKPDDLIDSLDTEAIWYKSTCLDSRILNGGAVKPDDENETPSIKEAYVAYRYYDDIEGHKFDDDGKKYVGWSNKYDEWNTVTSPTI